MIRRVAAALALVVAGALLGVVGSSVLGSAVATDEPTLTAEDDAIRSVVVSSEGFAVVQVNPDANLDGVEVLNSEREAVNGAFLRDGQASTGFRLVELESPVVSKQSGGTYGTNLPPNVRERLDVGHECPLPPGEYEVVGYRDGETVGMTSMIIEEHSTLNGSGCV